MALPTTVINSSANSRQLPNNKLDAEINNNMQKIAQIIGIIDEIAFQTNLLALNAATEVARNGEQGRNLSIKASEVKEMVRRGQRCDQRD